MLHPHTPSLGLRAKGRHCSCYATPSQGGLLNSACVRRECPWPGLHVFPAWSETVSGDDGRKLNKLHKAAFSKQEASGQPGSRMETDKRGGAGEEEARAREAEQREDAHSGGLQAKPATSATHHQGNLGCCSELAHLHAATLLGQHPSKPRLCWARCTPVSKLSWLSEECLLENETDSALKLLE